jgi:hypothetical protein
MKIFINLNLLILKRKMRQKFLIGVVLLLMFSVISTVVALDVTKTELTIKTEPQHNLDIKIFNADNDKKVQSFLGKETGDSGEVKVSISSIGVKEIYITLNVKKGNLKVFDETYETYPTGKPITLNIDPYPKPEENVTANESVVSETINKTEVEENYTKEKTGITGKTIGNKIGRVFSKEILIILVVIIIAGFAIYFVVKLIRKKGFPQNIIVRKQSELVAEREKLKEESKEDDKLASIEKKLRALLEDVIKMRNKDKIEEAKKRLEGDRRELEKLEKGEA